MKKVLKLILVLLVVYSMALTCFATDDTLSVTDATAEPGDVVYLTLMLNEKTVGNSLGVSTVYDSNILVPAPSSSSWAGSGTLQDFNKQGAGVWAIKSAKDLQGTVCVLAFQVKEDASFTTTTVECTLIVKNEGKDVGTYKAEAVVSYNCDHSYGAWENNSNLGHSRSCSLCKGTQTESHSWDEGTVSAKPNDSKTNLMTYTCETCGGTKVIEFAAGSGEEAPTAPTVPTVPTVTKPEETLPTAPTEPITPVTRPTEDPTGPSEEDHVHGESTYPNSGSNPGTSNNPGASNNQNNNDSHDGHDHTGKPSDNVTVTTPYQDYNQPSGDADDHSGHSHAEPTDPPIAVPIVSGSHEEETTQEHVHTEEELIHEHTSISIGSVCAVLGALVIITAAAVYFVKKKH